MSRRTTRRAASAAGLATLLVATLSSLSSAPVHADAGRTRAHQAALSTTVWRPNGAVDAVLATPKRIYLGGDFTRIVGPGGHTRLQRLRVVALSAATGRPVRSFKVRVNGTVRAIAIFDHQVFIGGDFTRVNGRPQAHLAALRPADGRLLGPAVTPVDGTVRALLTMGGRLYVGGKFTSVSGVARDDLFALNRSGDLVDAWPAVPSGTNGAVYALAAAPDRSSVVVGGAFHTLLGEARDWLGAVSTAGQVTPWAPPAACATGCLVKDLAVGATRVYAGIAGPGGHVTAYRWSDGGTAWTVRANGDVEAVALAGRSLLLGGHFDKVARRKRSMFAQLSAGDGTLSSRRLSTTGQRWPGVLDIAVSRRGVLLAGDFDGISGQRRLAVVSR